MLLYDKKHNPIRATFYKYRSCRNCKHFIRVKEKKYNPVRKRGFCIKGQGENDFRLYLSSSGSRECEHFMLDKGKLMLTKREDDFSNRARSFGYNYAKKQLRVIRKALKRDGKRVNFLDTILMESQLEADGVNKFNWENFDEYKELCDSVDWTEEEHQMFIDAIQCFAENFNKQKLKRVEK